MAKKITMVMQEEVFKRLEELKKNYNLGTISGTVSNAIEQMYFLHSKQKDGFKVFIEDKNGSKSELPLYKI